MPRPVDAAIGAQVDVVGLVNVDQQISDVAAGFRGVDGDHPHELAVDLEPQVGGHQRALARPTQPTAPPAHHQHVTGQDLRGSRPATQHQKNVQGYLRCGRLAEFSPKRNV